MENAALKQVNVTKKKKKHKTKSEVESAKAYYERMETLRKSFSFRQCGGGYLVRKLKFREQS